MLSKSFTWVRANWDFVLLSLFFSFALFNPVFKKLDFGAGWPLVVLLGVIIGSIGVVKYKEKVAVRDRLIKWEMTFLGLFLLFFLLSFVFSETQNTGLGEMMAFLLMGTFYLLYAYQKIKWKVETLRFVLACAGLASLIGIVMYIFQNEARLFSTFISTLAVAHRWPNAFALFLLLSWPLLLLFRNIRMKWLLILLAGVIFSALFLSYSRGAMIAFAGQLFLFLIYFVRRFDKKSLAMVALTILVSSGLVFSINYLRSLNNEVLSVREKVTFQNQEKATSVDERIQFWNGAIKLIGDEPLLGYGPGSFQYAYAPIQSNLLATSTHPHNIFLKIGAENGVIALVAFVGFLLMIFWRMLISWKYLSKTKKDFIFILGVGLLGAIAHNLIDYNFNFISNLFLFFLFLALISSEILKNTGLRLKKRKFLRVFSVFLAVFAIFEGGIFLAAQLNNEDYLKYSFYPRNFYLEEAEEDLKADNWEEALEDIGRQIELNGFEAQAYFLRGEVYCDEAYRDYDLEACLGNYEKALEINPMNHFQFYRAYFGAAIRYRDYSNIMGKGELFDWAEFENHKEKALDLLRDYFDYVENNVHFTAYTDNVEAAAALIELLSAEMNEEDREFYLKEREEMLEDAKRIRLNK